MAGIMVCMQKTDESLLIIRCLSGSDPAAWDEFATSYADLIWSMIHKTFAGFNVSYQKEDVEDLFNSIYVSLVDDDFRKLRQFQGENNCSLSTWLAVVAGRMTIDFIRKDKTRLFADNSGEGPQLWETIADAAPLADHRISEEQIQGQISREVSQLAPRDRLLYHLLFVRGASAEATAGVLGMSVGLVYSRKHRIINRLKKSFGTV